MTALNYIIEQALSQQISHMPNETSPRTSRSRRIQPQRREHILEHAAMLFRKYGYSATTVRQIAQAVGVQSGALFYHFPSKEAILAGVVARGLEQISRAVDNASNNGQSPRERLQAMLTAHLEILLGPAQDALIVMINEWRHLGANDRIPLLAARDGYEARWQQALDAAARTGLVPDDTRLLRRYLLGALNWTHQWYHADGPLTPQTIAQRYLVFLLGEDVSAAAADQTIGENANGSA